MRSGRRASARAHAPIFFSFFTWGFGTGAQNLGRPLFAFAVTGNVFLVGVMLAANALPRAFTGPVTGFLTERLGRKPMVVAAPIVRGATNIGQFFADDYVTFLVLELIGQIGVAMWATSSNVLLSDVTHTASRGRVLALRHMATRIGFVAGPAVGGAFAAAFGLESVFLLNGLSKAVIVVVVIAMVKETRPQAEGGAAPAGRGGLSLAPFRDRTFAAVAAATAVFAMGTAGIMQTLVPVHAAGPLQLDARAIGGLISLTSLITTLWALPNGVIADRFGRKWSLAPGLLTMGAASAALGISETYGALVAAAALIGVGEAMGLGTTQTYAMDLARREERGLYMGLSTLAQSVGAVAGPALLAGLYHYLFPQTAFFTMGALLLAATILLVAVAQETAGSRRRR